MKKNNNYQNKDKKIQNNIKKLHYNQNNKNIFIMQQDNN